MKHFRRKDNTFLSLMATLLIAQTFAQGPPMIQPISYSIPSPPMLMGPLSANNILTNAEKVHVNLIKGPTSFVNHDGHLYACTRDSKIYDLASCPPRLIANLASPGCYGKSSCGQLTSLRFDPTTRYLLVLDTFRGLFAVHPLTGVSKLVFSTNTPVNGRRPVHLNDMVVSPQGVIIMSDSSDTYDIDNDIYICMDGRLTGSSKHLTTKSGKNRRDSEKGTNAPPVNGRRPVHLNDMVVSPQGVIIMSDSSDTYNIENDVYICMDGRLTGRLLALYLRTGMIFEILPKHFNFPNGLELTSDGDLLVGETCRATIHRVSLKRTSWLQVNPFSVNLPGLPDNIRSSGRGTYWVAMSYPRHAGTRNPVDENSRIPEYRAQGFSWLSLKDLRDLFTKWAIVVELDDTGMIIGSLHDPTGATLTMVTEVNEFGGVLNIGSHLVDYMVRVLLPPETGVKISVESFIQVKRSRCQLPDSQVEATRRQLLGKQQTSNQTSPA